MKKIDRKIQQVKGDDFFACPKCGGHLSVVDRSLRCGAGHTYDFSRKGTVNFVLGYGEENYDMAMLEARMRVIEAGLFDGLYEALAEKIQDDLEARGRKDRTIHLLDAGCGDGSALEILGKKLLAKGVKARLFGIDISKDGIRIAGRRENDALYFVADLARMPFEAGTMDVIVNLFSPANYQEFFRVLAPSGRLYKVVPKAEHLMELRTAFGMKAYDNGEILQHLAAHAKVLGSEDLIHPFYAEGILDDLLLMTPMLWGQGGSGCTLETSTITVAAAIVKAKKPESEEREEQPW